MLEGIVAVAPNDNNLLGLRVTVHTDFAKLLNISPHVPVRLLPLTEHLRRNEKKIYRMKQCDSDWCLTTYATELQ